MAPTAPGHGRDLMAAKAVGQSGLVKTTALQEEAMAYLTGALFHIHDTTPVRQAPTVPPWATGTGTYGVAHTIANSIWNIKGVALKDVDVTALIDAVKERYTYLKSQPKYRDNSYGV